MPLSTIITGALLDITKKHAFEVGKKVAHGFKDSATGKNIGQLINYRSQKEYNNVVLFVHGFSGDAAETFGRTPEIILSNPEFDGWDVFSIGYSSDIFPSIGKGLWSVNPDITKISFYLKTLLQHQFGHYDRMAFVAHSMGGLAVQRTILDLPTTDKSKISHLLLFGTPSKGLDKAYWFRFWNTQVKDLSSKSDFIVKLRDDWNTQFNNKIPFSFKTIAGSKDDFVSVTSSLHAFDKKYQGIIEGNHINMIKPIDENDINHQSYGIIRNLLLGVGISAALKGNSEEVNLVMGEYQTIVNKFLPIANKIGKRELADLVFALENTGKRSEAIRILKEHPSLSQDSDALGILGGRYKRMYLLEGLQDHLIDATKSYATALDIAVGNKDHSQVFYHAINLAFLSLVGNNDRKKMKEYAQLALDNCDSGHKDMWELATIAESNLYLGQLSMAETFYKKVAEVAGTDVRAKQSIYSNAFYGYQSFMATKDKNAEFLKMLEDVFLN